MGKNKIILITGGARSGKSDFALRLASKLKKEVIYLATAEARDTEMDERIKKHKLSRPPTWKTVEEPKRIAKVIEENRKFTGTIIIDCITLWLNNILSGKEDEMILEEVKNLFRIARKTDSTFIIISNEVGLGIVPTSKLGRRFRDLAGRVNQIIAKEADEVYFMLSGIPTKIKGEKDEKDQ